MGGSPFESLTLSSVAQAPSRVRHGDRQAFVTAVRLAGDAANPCGWRLPRGGGGTGAHLPDPRPRDRAARLAGAQSREPPAVRRRGAILARCCLLYTSDA